MSYYVTPKIIGRKASPGTQLLLIAAEWVGCRVAHEEPQPATATSDATPACQCGASPSLMVSEYGASSASHVKFITSEGRTYADDLLTGLRYFGRMRPDLGLYGFRQGDMTEVDWWLGAISHVACSCDKAGGSIMQIQKFVGQVMEPALLENTYLTGDRISLADLYAAVILSHLSAPQATGPKLSVSDFQNAARWLATVTAHPAVKKHLLVGPAPEKKKAAPGGASKENSVAAPAAAAKSAADVEDEIEAEAKAKAKAPNPLDMLPPTPLVLDAWKREFSNTKDVRGKAMPWFWQNYDAAGWSLWFMRYDKLEGENEVGFTTANMLGGFLQRLDPNFRKYSFAVLDVVGENRNFDIQGVWLWRGHEIPKELQDHPSFPYHIFRKLDAEKDRALIEDYWCNDE